MCPRPLRAAAGEHRRRKRSREIARRSLSDRGGHEGGVSAGSLVELGDLERGQILIRERSELDDEARGQSPERVVGVELLGSCGSDDREREGGTAPLEIRDRRQRCRVCPVQIVEDEQHGRVRPYELDQGLERVDLRVRAVGTRRGRARAGSDGARAALGGSAIPSSASRTASASGTYGRWRSSCEHVARPILVVGKDVSSSASRRDLPRPASPSISVSENAPSSVCRTRQVHRVELLHPAEEPGGSLGGGDEAGGGTRRPGEELVHVLVAEDGCVHCLRRGHRLEPEIVVEVSAQSLGRRRARRADVPSAYSASIARRCARSQNPSIATAASLWHSAAS